MENPYFGENICSPTPLASIIIPDSVTSIGYGAFCGCESLTSVIIPDSVKTIKNGAFDECDNLNKVVYYGTEDSFKQIEMDDDTRSTLASLVKYEEKPLP